MEVVDKKTVPLWIKILLGILLFLIIAAFIYSVSGLSEAPQRFCDIVPSKIWRDDCYFYFARYAQDPLVCEELSDLKAKQVCLAEITLDSSNCDESNPGCFYRVALLKNDSTGCDKIIDEEQRITCLSDVGEKSQNISVCNKINNSEYLAHCYSGVAVASNNISICDEEFRIYGNADKCYWALVGRNNASSDNCEKIVDENIKGYCYVSVADSNDISSCIKLPQENVYRYTCINMAAELAQNASLCLELGSDVYISECVKKIARKKKDTALCNLNTVEESKVSCIMNIAADMKDSNICKLITSPFYVNSCYEYVNETMNNPYYQGVN